MLHVNLFGCTLLGERGIFLSFPLTLRCDNLGHTYLTINSIMHSQTKHIELDYHFIHERVAEKPLQVSFVSNKDQLTDILTKPLSTSQFLQLRSSLTLTLVPLELQGMSRHLLEYWRSN